MECNFYRNIVHEKKLLDWVNYQRASAVNEFFLENTEKCEEILANCIEKIKHKEITRKN